VRGVPGDHVVESRQGVDKFPSLPLEVDFAAQTAGREKDDRLLLIPAILQIGPGLCRELSAADFLRFQWWPNFDQHAG